MDDKRIKDKKENTVTRHTWIGDEEEVARQAEMAERKTYTLSPQATRIVEKQRKKRTGFITDEELKNSDIIRIEDRRTTLVNKEDISQTRIYDPLLHGPDAGDEEKPAPPPKPKYITVKATPAGMRKALIGAAVLVLMLLIFEISFFVMRSDTGKLPARTEAAAEETAKLAEENTKLEEQAAAYGSEDEMKELKESWERLREKLGNTE